MRINPRRFLKSVFVIVAAVMFFVLFDVFVQNDQPVIDPSTVPRVPSQSVNPSDPSTSSASPGNNQPDPKECKRQASKPFVPVMVVIPGVARGSVVSLGLDENDAPAAPSFDQPNMFSWYNLGPAPASEAGNVLFSAHTFSSKTVLGNVLLERLRSGDLIIVKGAAKAETLCYRVASGPKPVKPARYPELVYRFEGSSQAVITVCSNYNTKTKEWEKRTVWFAEPLL